MHLSKSLEIIDLGLYIKKKVLVFADFHIGFEESMNKRGILVPRLQFKDIMQRLENILKKVRPEIIVINGDIKHEFGKISDQEWRETLKLIDFLAKHCKNLILTRGNHDKILGSIAEKRNIKILDYFEFEDFLITHGDIIPEDISRYKTIIIGHEHPAFSVNEGGRTEKFKCFLAGKYKSKNLIVQPSFNSVTEGTDVLEEKTLSPFLKQDLADFEVYVVADRVYDFGKLKNFR